MKLSSSKFHFVGIGGVGMCGIAEILLSLGAKVTGSDLHQSANTDRLMQKGAKIFFQHRRENIVDADVVVYSTAVQNSNPEIVEAKRLRIPLIHRAEALAEIMRLKRGITVAGTHGKTTTTSMVSAVFLEAGTHPTVFVGGRFDLINSTARHGEGEWFIAEADESDGSFHKLQPEIAIITNVDSDHLDHFKTFENLQKSFYDFSLRVSFYGHLIVCGDDPLVRKLFEHYPKRISFYGFDPLNDFVIEGEKGKYQLSQNLDQGSKKLGVFYMELPGRHNALNACASIICGMITGIDFQVAAKALLSFQGADRRFQLKGEANGIMIYDDYGHHPTEIRCTLQAFKEKFPANRIVTLFQPHRFSRTLNSWAEFLNCFPDTDVLFITDIYSAGENPIVDIHSEKLVEEVRHQNKAYLPKEKAAEKMKDFLRPGDVFVTLGAGDGWKIGEELIAFFNH